MRRPDAEPASSRRTPSADAFLRAIVGRRPEVVWGTVLTCVHQAAETAVPILIGAVVDAAIATGDSQALLLWLAALAANFVALALGGLWGYHLLDRAELRVAHDVRMRIVDRALAPSGGADAAARTGQLVALGTGDASRAASVVWALGLGLSGLVALAIAAVALLLVSPLLGVLVLLGIPAVLAGSHRVAEPLEARARHEQEAAAMATATASDLLRGVRVIAGLSARRAATARYRSASRHALALRTAAAGALGRFEAITLAVVGLFLVLVGWLAARMALSGEITIGALVTVVGLAQFLGEPLERTARAFGTLAGSRASAGRALELLGAPPAVVPGEAAVPEGPGALRIGAIDVPAGALVALDGMVPQRTQAIVDALGRHAEPEEPVALDGRDIRALELDGLRAAVHVADHDAWVPAGTLADALAGVPEWALEAAAADEVLDSVGPDADLGQAGAALSGGQRQRVALARALALCSPVLVLHDPTSAVDTVTEQRIAAGLRRARAGRTTLVLTSSPALRAAADVVLP